MSVLPTFRFAPSPNGELHRGHAYSALLNHELAQRLGGRFLVRIEDIDTGRARVQFEQQIFDDLAWLGLSWVTPVRRQSEHLEVYEQALGKLRRMGIVYPCFATRREIVEHPRTARMPLNPDGAPLYPGLYREYDRTLADRRILSGEPYALRLDMQKALALAGERTTQIDFDAWQPDDTITQITADPAQWGDIILARKDAPASYTLAVVVDDALQGVTHVVRGMDLYHATSLQRLLQILLELPSPLYHHHQLILDETGGKLAKSRFSRSLRQERADGLTRQQLCLQLPATALE